MCLTHLFNVLRSAVREGRHTGALRSQDEQATVAPPQQAEEDGGADTWGGELWGDLWGGDPVRWGPVIIRRFDFPKI